jgi:hypothetical protein
MTSRGPNHDRVIARHREIHFPERGTNVNCATPRDEARRVAANIAKLPEAAAPWLSGLAAQHGLRWGSASGGRRLAARRVGGTQHAPETKSRHDHICHSLELFAREVLPEFDERQGTRDQAQAMMRKEKVAPLAERFQASSRSGRRVANGPQLTPEQEAARRRMSAAHRFHSKIRRRPQRRNRLRLSSVLATRCEHLPAPGRGLDLPSSR